jgi:hypothetical protein
MLTKQLSIAIAISIGISIGSGMARSDLKMLAAAPTTETRIDFDQVFAAATQRSEFNLSIHDRLRHVGTVDGRARVIACRTSSPFYRILHCSPTASQWHPRSPIRSWAALLVAATHINQSINIPTFFLDMMNRIDSKRA